MIYILMYILMFSLNTKYLIFWNVINKMNHTTIHIFWYFINCSIYHILKCHCQNVSNLKWHFRHISLTFLSADANGGVVARKRLAHYRPYVRGIHQSRVASPRERPAMRSLDIILLCIINKLLNTLTQQKRAFIVNRKRTRSTNVSSFYACPIRNINGSSLDFMAVLYLSYWSCSSCFHHLGLLFSGV